jgi:hypothetical protein
LAHRFVGDVGGDMVEGDVAGKLRRQPVRLGRRRARLVECRAGQLDGVCGEAGRGRIAYKGQDVLHQCVSRPRRGLGTEWKGEVEQIWMGSLNDSKP